MSTVLTPTTPWQIEELRELSARVTDELRTPVIRDLRQRVADAERAYNNLSADRRTLFAQLLRERQQRKEAEERARVWEQRARAASWDALPAVDPT